MTGDNAYDLILFCYCCSRRKELRQPLKSSTWWVCHCGYRLGVTTRWEAEENPRWFFIPNTCKHQQLVTTRV